MNCFVFRVDGVLRGPRSGLLPLLGLVVPHLGTLRVADVGAGRVATVVAPCFACVRRAVLGCFINPQRVILRAAGTDLAVLTH